MRSASLLALLGVLLIAAGASATDPSDPNYLLEQIYRTYTEATEKPCVRLLDADGVIGCGSAFSHTSATRCSRLPLRSPAAGPVRAPLVSVMTDVEFTSFISDTSVERKTVLLSPSLFNMYAFPASVHPLLFVYPRCF